MSRLIFAPFTKEQVEGLNRWQHYGFVHEFTCGKCSASLVAEESGWICPSCGNTQNWAHEFMVEEREDLLGGVDSKIALLRLAEVDEGLVVQGDELNHAFEQLSKDENM